MRHDLRPEARGHRVLRAEGPWFDELEHGQQFATAPALTLTTGRAAAHQALLGDRLRLPLDDDLAQHVTGARELAHPALVWNVAIGQSTLATQHVRANLFYRRLVLLRQPALDDTLRTTTTVAGLRENRRKPGRPATGLAALHIRTLDQCDRPVLDFYRCAMLPLRGSASTGHADDLDQIGRGVAATAPEACVASFDLAAWRRRVTPEPPPEPGTEVEVVGGDVVVGAPELARLTLNVAAVHHDAWAAGGQRLVYGGHTIGIALSQVTRAFPDMVTVLAWDGCDHTGPVHEGDTLRSHIRVDDVRRLEDGHVVDLRVSVSADSDSAEPSRNVLDWRFSALFA